MQDRTLPEIEMKVMNICRQLALITSAYKWSWTTVLVLFQHETGHVMFVAIHYMLYVPCTVLNKIYYKIHNDITLAWLLNMFSFIIYVFSNVFMISTHWLYDHTLQLLSGNHLGKSAVFSFYNIKVLLKYPRLYQEWSPLTLHTRIQIYPPK